MQQSHTSQQSRHVSHDNETVKQLVDENGLARIRARALIPKHPKINGTIIGSKYVLQTVEKLRKPYEKLTEEVENMMEQFGEVVGCHYKKTSSL